MVQGGEAFVRPRRCTADAVWYQWKGGRASGGRLAQAGTTSIVRNLKKIQDIARKSARFLTSRAGISWILVISVCGKISQGIPRQLFDWASRTRKADFFTDKGIGGEVVEGEENVLGSKWRVLSYREQEALAPVTNEPDLRPRLPPPSALPATRTSISPHPTPLCVPQFPVFLSTPSSRYDTDRRFYRNIAGGIHGLYNTHACAGY
ncbi:hypothetical protein B0H13DRAFT_1856080 [Mycena leptocephala]|nr:hypothetical protein B0H13DRAFT_1856080 [Mycena leptocephala]